MTSRYDAKNLRGSGLRRRPLASPSHADIDPRWTCPFTAAHRRAQRRAGRQWSSHSTPGSGGTRAHTIGADSGTVAPPTGPKGGRTQTITQTRLPLALCLLRLLVWNAVLYGLPPTQGH